MKKNYTALIVDDEEDNAKLLSYFLVQYCPEVDVLGYRTNVTDAVFEFNRVNPDILFLDIKLGTEDSFKILDQIDSSSAQLIFVTAYEEYALKAIKYSASGYLLKPIQINELKSTVDLAVKAIENQTVKVLNSSLDSAQETLEYFSFSVGGAFEVVLKKDVFYLIANGKKTNIYLKDRSFESVKSIGYFEQKLVDKNFFRTHQSYIVNITHLKRIERTQGYYCLMSDNKTIPISRRMQEVFFNHIGV